MLNTIIMSKYKIRIVFLVLHLFRENLPKTQSILHCIPINMDNNSKTVSKKD